MIKRLVFGAAAGALALAPLSARADWYVNPEFNGASFGDDYLGGAINFDLGFEGSSGAYSYYVQGGPAIVAIDGEDTETEFSGKAGASVALSSKLGAYGELSAFIGSGDANVDRGYGGKLGLKYNF